METKQSFSLRKLSVGLASVLIGISFLNGTKANVVKADIKESPKENVQDARDKNSEDMQSAILKNTSSQNADVQNTTQTDHTSVDTSTDSSTSADQVGQVAGAERGDSSARETRTSQLKQVNSNKSTQTSQLKQVNSNKSTQTSQLKPVNSNQSTRTRNTNLTVLTKLALNLSQTKNFSLQSLKESKIVANTTNGGFDEATWGKLDVNDWQGSAQNGVYQLTYYTGDPSHIIVPNEADFEKAGKSTNGLQVGIDKYAVNLLFSRTHQERTIAFSKTNNEKVKAIGTDWSYAFSSTLSKFDGSNLDVSNVTNMFYMFYDNSISDLSSLANWDVSNVTDMSYMFASDSISDLTSLTHWDTSKVTNMNWMFYGNKISDLSSLTNWNTSEVTNISGMFSNNAISDLTSLAHWNTSQVTDMHDMFEENSISDLTPLAKWNTSQVTNMSGMFALNPDLIDLKPIANWNVSGVSFVFGGLFNKDTKLNLTNINNTPLMQGFLKEPDALKGATFITNNADLVKATINKDISKSTTAKRTIVFNIPHTAPKTIVQIINYKDTAPAVQVNFNSKKIVQTYPVKESDWQLDTSKQNDDVIIDGVICFKPVKIPHVNGYKAYLIKDPVNPNALLVSFIALPQQSQNNQLLQKPIQAKQNQPEPIQTKPANDKQTDQIIDHISYTLMHDSSNVGNFELAQNDPALLEAFSNSTQKDDAVKIVNTVKPKKHIVKKHVTKKRKKHVKKYHLKRRSRKHAKKRVIKHKKHASKKFRRFHLKRIKRVKH